MSYSLVIPRDLFNHAKLLKCMGQLSLFIHDGVRWPLRLEFDDSESAGFSIVQSQDDGSLSVANLVMTIGECRIDVCTPYNCKDAYPLRFTCGDYSGDVFTYDGAQFHSDFILFLNAYAPAIGCGKATRVEGTNGGFMACGALLTRFGKIETYLCAKCSAALTNGGTP